MEVDQEEMIQNTRKERDGLAKQVETQRKQIHQEQIELLNQEERNLGELIEKAKEEELQQQFEGRTRLEITFKVEEEKRKRAETTRKEAEELMSRAREKQRLVKELEREVEAETLGEVAAIHKKAHEQFKQVKEQKHEVAKKIQEKLRDFIEFERKHRSSNSDTEERTNVNFLV
ncbi:MAG: hypothetical protein K0R63_851 [Rickettsiales bacterium]|jgi:hypothetical protein|nr:hypothetical protein [Rickettsiales bacterium]